MQNIEAVLFDLDGVLADSMEDNFLAWEKTFQDYNIEIKKEDYFPLEGMQLREIAKIISRKYNINPEPKEVVNKKNRYYLQDYKFSFYSGVEQLIDRLLGKNKLLAVVSASPREKLEKTVPLEFLNKFNVIVSGDDTEKGKPDPEPYLVALRKLNIQQGKCVVIENAPLGITSAKKAGLYCIALTTTLNKDYLKQADMIVKNHEELITLLLN